MAGDWIQETVADWREWAAVRRSLGYDDVAMTLRACANRLEKIWDEPLTVREAAEESGYCPETLYGLIRNGTIPNVGESGAPRIRRRDVPIRPGANERRRASRTDKVGGLP